MNSPTLRQLQQQNMKPAFILFPELHNLAIESGMSGIGEYLATNPQAWEQTESKVRGDLLMKVCGMK